MMMVRGGGVPTTPLAFIPIGVANAVAGLCAAAISKYGGYTKSLQAGQLP
jgi:hypothetical protein